MMQNHSHHLRCRADHHSSLSSSARSRQENRSANSFFQRPASAGLRCEHPQEPRLRISSRSDSAHDAALRHVAAQFALHRRHPRQAAGRAGWAEEGHRHRGAQRLGPAALVEAAGVAAS